MEGEGRAWIASFVIINMYKFKFFCKDDFVKMYECQKKAPIIYKVMKNCVYLQVKRQKRRCCRSDFPTF